MRVQFIILLIALVVFTTVCAIISFRTFRTTFRKYNESKLHPIGKDKLTTIMKGTNHTATITFLGDSRAVDWCSSFSQTNTIAHNNAINGFTTSQTLIKIREEGYVPDNETLIIQVGINDLKCISYDRLREEEIIAGCIDNITKITQILDTNTTKIVVTTVFPVPKETLEFLILYPNYPITESITRVNDALKNLSGGSIYVFDSYKYLANEKGNLKNEFKKDYLHVNSRAYGVLNIELKQFLLEKKIN